MTWTEEGDLLPADDYDPEWVEWHDCTTAREKKRLTRRRNADEFNPNRGF